LTYFKGYLAVKEVVKKFNALLKGRHQFIVAIAGPDDEGDIVEILIPDGPIPGFRAYRPIFVKHKIVH
jgi:hypothetical protein